MIYEKIENALNLTSECRMDENRKVSMKGYSQLILSRNEINLIMQEIQENFDFENQTKLISIEGIIKKTLRYSTNPELLNILKKSKLMNLKNQKQYEESSEGVAAKSLIFASKRINSLRGISSSSVEDIQAGVTNLVISNLNASEVDMKTEEIKFADVYSTFVLPKYNEVIRDFSIDALYGKSTKRRAKVSKKVIK